MKDRLRYRNAVGIKVKKGKPPKGQKPDKKQLERFYVNEEKSIRQISDKIGCTKDMVYRALDEYGINRRTNAKRSKLSTYDKSYLKQEVKEKGITQVAKDLSVDVRTLRKYI